MTQGKISNAKTLANQYARVGTYCAFVGEYSDGNVIYLSCTIETQERLWKLMQGTEQARSDDDQCGVIITDGLHLLRDLLHLQTAFDAYQIAGRDNRSWDDHSIVLHCENIRMGIGGGYTSEDE